MYRELLTKTIKIYYVYILKYSDKRYYTGFTSNLEKRFFEHQQGKHIESYTYNKRPLELFFFAEFTEARFAIDTEKQIKNGQKLKRKL